MMGMFTASKTQITTYLFVVCPFSIAFLVFLNSSVSFVITDLIGQQNAVGDAVGNLGFADELVALLACPLWGLLSDRIGVRSVCFIGYTIVGVALFLFVQAKHVYPDLLLGRLFFSLGGSAASTMVTAVLPTMSFRDSSDSSQRSNGHAYNTSVASEQTITPSNYRASQSPSSRTPPSSQNEQTDSVSKIAGFVGMATGCGALVALSIFLPLPARFQRYGVEPGQALKDSYYIVGTIALFLGVVCLLGLRGLQSDHHKGWRQALRGDGSGLQTLKSRVRSTWDSLYRALVAGFSRGDIFIGYVGGFVARASSVGISLFIPLLINAAFRSSGLCSPEQTFKDPSGLPDIKRKCPRAYVVAAELTGVSQLVALLCAPLFGYWSSRIRNKNIPLMFAAIAGIIGYPLFAVEFTPHDEDTAARAISFLAVFCIGISQIGAIVCSLGILSRGIASRRIGDGSDEDDHTDRTEADGESDPLINSGPPRSSNNTSDLSDLKGSVAGIYSFYGGAGILLLTKAGGALFDSSTRAAPFYLMASFNGILLIACLAIGFKRT